MKKSTFVLPKVWVLIGLCFILGCNKDDNGGGSVIPEAPVCTITNPQNNAQFRMDENILVTVVAESPDGAIDEVQLYIDDIGYSFRITSPYNFTINAGELSAGSYSLKAVARDNRGVKAESTVSIIIDQPDQPGTESPDFVSFSDGKIPNTWLTTFWVIDNTVGYDDTYSLKATAKGIDVATIKTFDAPSYIEFYTTGDNFNFYIDGARPNFIGSSDAENWQKWIYAISSGTHIFKWKPTSPDKLNLDAIKFAAAGLPEVQTGNVTPNNDFSAATVNYMLSSNGNHTMTAHGVCWSTSPNPTIADDKTVNTESIVGSYTNIIGNLTPKKTYYVRAYASNELGTVYGEELSFETPGIVVGSRYQGGIVAYIDETGEHGLIAAPEDQGAVGIVWIPTMTFSTTGATGTAIGTGKSNTKAIVQILGPGSYAAKLCDDLVLNGYDDWYLPSKDELYMLYLKKYTIGGFDTVNNNANSIYWSSSEFDKSRAWYQSFYSGIQDHFYTKDNTFRVRAIRSF